MLLTDGAKPSLIHALQMSGLCSNKHGRQRRIRNSGCSAEVTECKCCYLSFLHHESTNSGCRDAHEKISSLAFLKQVAALALAPVTETGFSHRLTAYKIVEHFF